MKRADILLLVVCLVAAGCGGRQTPSPVRSLELPKTLVLPAVRPAEPAFRLSFRRSIRRGLVKDVSRRGLVGVPIQLKKMRVASLARALDLRVGAVRPLAYRPLAPAPTRAADFVWTSLLQGEAVITPSAVERLRLTTDTQLVIGNETIRIGAFADAAVPNFADILIPASRAADLQLGRSRLLVVGVRRKTRRDELRARLERLAPGARIRSLTATGPSAPPEPLGTAEGPLIGAMTYRVREDGFIEPDPSWIEANISSATVPLLGAVTCHRLMLPQLGAALAEIERRGLEGAIDARRYGGCYVPRFIGRDPRRGLSLHAFGLAIDLNVSTNHYGTRGDMDPRVVAIFDKWGFAWGGTWSTPDPMHFELARLVSP